MEISSEHLHSQTIRARELKFWENVHPPPCVTCHMSRVRSQVSWVSWFFFFLSGGASRWRVCYQRGLPRLVFMKVDSMTLLLFNHCHHHHSLSSYTPPSPQSVGHSVSQSPSYSKAPSPSPAYHAMAMLKTDKLIGQKSYNLQQQLEKASIIHIQQKFNKESRFENMPTTK